MQEINLALEGKLYRGCVWFQLEIALMTFKAEVDDRLFYPRHLRVEYRGLFRLSRQSERKS